MSEKIKTSFVIPRHVYIELKKKAVEEGRPIRDLVVEAIVEYLAKPRNNKARKRLVRLIEKPVEGAGREDYVEYEYQDLDESL